MVQVSLTASLRGAVGGAEVVEIEARTIRELLNALVQRFPRFADQLATGVAVAVNGEIYRDNWEREIPANAEVYLLPRIKGG